MNIQEVKIPSTNGLLSAVINQLNADENKLAILCPGYLDQKDYDHLARLSKDLCNAGYTVVRFDPTGTWESEGDISQYMMSHYLDNVKSILEYMLKTKHYSEILLGGHSRGGQIAILYSSIDDRITKVLGIMASYGSPEGKRREDWRNIGFSVEKRDMPKDKSKINEFNVPFKHVLDHDKYNALEAIRKIHVPIILLAGELDQAVTPEDVKDLYENANEPKRYILLKGIDHDYRFNSDKISIVNEGILNALSLMK